MEKCIDKEMPLFGRVSYKRCVECNFLYSDHIEKSSKEFVTKYYKSQSFDQDDPGYKSRAKTALLGLIAICNKLKLNLNDISVLDYGCGEGLFVSNCHDIGIRAFGFDPYYIQESKKNNDNYFYGEDKLINLKEKFDFVTCFEVVEHAITPEIFRRLLDLCKPNGYLYFSTGMYIKSLHDSGWEYLVPAHCSIYSVSSLEVLAGNYSATRLGLVRQPFVDISYMLTGELWLNGNRLTNNQMNSEKTLKIDFWYSRMNNLFKGRFIKIFAKFFYKNSIFISTS